MRNYIGYIIDYSDGTLTKRKRKWFEKELAQNTELKNSYLLYRQVNELMRGKFDQVEVLNDPDRKIIDSQTKLMISEFSENQNGSTKDREFIQNSLNNFDEDHKLQLDLDQAKLEADNFRLNEETGKWVDEWNAKNHKEDKETNNRRAFISSSLNLKVPNESLKKRSSSRNFVIRTAILSAAALIATILIVKTLNTSDSPEKLYQEYYKPFNAYTSTTRNSSISDNSYSNAVEKYNKGDYIVAASLFSELINDDANNISFRFFGGITQMELSNYHQSIILLNDVVSKDGEFKKEALWYLGLDFIKVGENQKARSCFLELAKSKGYYQSQAQELLNHLK
jgi:hypothetical protein